jgi:hypothetical protein
MKNLIFIGVVSILMLTIITTVISCDKKDLLAGDPIGSDDLALRGGPNSDSCFLLNPSASVNEAEIEMLKYMREEEKLAHDVYRYFFTLYNVPVFKNISNSEQRHMSRIKCLLDHYEIPDPLIDEQGKFTNTDLQQLYTTLTEQGKVSVTEAYKIGATIEDLDIKDLDSDLTQTENPAIKDIFERLMCGSRNHMRSFYSLLIKVGGTYSAQYISSDELTAIVTTEKEFCGNNQGNTCDENGKKGKKGKGGKHGKNNGNCDNSNGNSGGNNGNGGNGNGGNGNDCNGNGNGNAGNGNGNNGNGNGNGGNGNGNNSNGNNGNGNGNGGSGNGGNGGK